MDHINPAFGGETTPVNQRAGVVGEVLTYLPSDSAEEFPTSVGVLRDCVFVVENLDTPPEVVADAVERALSMTTWPRSAHQDLARYVVDDCLITDGTETESALGRTMLLCRLICDVTIGPRADEERIPVIVAAASLRATLAAAIKLCGDVELAVYCLDEQVAHMETLYAAFIKNAPDGTQAGVVSRPTYQRLAVRLHDVLQAAGLQQADHTPMVKDGWMGAGTIDAASLWMNAPAPAFPSCWLNEPNTS